MTDYDTLRTAMVDCQVRPSDVTKFPIISAMLAVRREVFVPSAKREVAYVGDHVDLGQGRVVLDPRIFSKMLDSLNITPGEMVLDIGCGLGYSAAVIGHLAEAVIALESDKTLATEAESNLAAQAIDNAIVVTGTLAEGAAKHGPYDAICVSGGAVEDIPAHLLDQLKEGGRVAAIFATGLAGECRVGIKTNGIVAWHGAFDATAPVLKGFEKTREFAL